MVHYSTYNVNLIKILFIIGALKANSICANAIAPNSFASDTKLELKKEGDNPPLFTTV